MIARYQFVRYADDFVITGSSKELLEEIKSLLPERLTGILFRYWSSARFDFSALQINTTCPLRKWHEETTMNFKPAVAIMVMWSLVATNPSAGRGCVKVFAMTMWEQTNAS